MGWRRADTGGDAPYPGNFEPFPALGGAPPPYRPYYPIYGPMTVQLRVKVTTWTNGTQDAGSGVWGSWTNDITVLSTHLVGGNHPASVSVDIDGHITLTEPDHPNVTTGQLDVEIAGRNIPIQITVEDVAYDQRDGGTTPVYTVNDPVVIQAGGSSASFSYGDPGLGKRKGMNRVMICLPAEG